MLQHTRLEHRFVHYIPEQLEPGVIYISMDYAIAAHACCCGCGEQAITPFTPTDWELTFDGETISLWPSVGNWNFKCQSHYIIRHNRVIAAEPWCDQQVEGGRRRDKRRKQRHSKEKDRFENAKAYLVRQLKGTGIGLWAQIKKWLPKRGSNTAPQRHGTGLSLATPRWIRPTVVMKDNGPLVETRIYDVPNFALDGEQP